MLVCYVVCSRKSIQSCFTSCYHDIKFDTIIQSKMLPPFNYHSCYHYTVIKSVHKVFIKEYLSFSHQCCSLVLHRRSFVSAWYCGLLPLSPLPCHQRNCTFCLSPWTEMIKCKMTSAEQNKCAKLTQDTPITKCHGLVNSMVYRIQQNLLESRHFVNFKQIKGSNSAGYQTFAKYYALKYGFMRMGWKLFDS